MIISESHEEREQVGDNMHSVSFRRKFALSKIAKKTIKVHKSRKALSPIFATLIILAIVTILFIPVFIWATNMSSTTQNSWQQSGIAATERIVIEAVSFNKTDPVPNTDPLPLNVQNATIYVRNIGETAVTINDVLITPTTSSANVQTYQKIPISMVPSKNQLSTVKPLTSTSIESVVKGDLIEIDLARLNCTNTGFRIISGTTYTVQVFTTRGISDTYQVVA